MLYLLAAALLVLAIVLTIKMIRMMRIYNQNLRLQARADYYQARIERSIKTFHIR